MVYTFQTTTFFQSGVYQGCRPPRAVDPPCLQKWCHKDDSTWHHLWMQMKCHTTPGWACFLIQHFAHFAHFLLLLFLKYFSRDARKKSFTFLQQVRIGISPCLLDKNSTQLLSSHWYFLFLLTTSISVKEKLILPFFTRDYSGPKSRMMTSSCRKKGIQLRGKENTCDIFKQHLVTRLHAFSP